MEVFASGALRGRADPEDTREEAVWTPAFPLGAPGWQASEKPLCIQDTSDVGPIGALTSFGVWADARGVWTSATWAGANSGGPTKIRFNDGGAWTTRLQDEVGGRDTAATNQLSGMPGGPLVLLNYRTYDFSPYIAPADSVTLFDKLRVTLEPPLGASDAAFAVAAFGTTAKDAYVLVQEGPAPAGSSVHRYRGGTWSQVGTIPNSTHAIWASNTQIVVAADGALFRALPSTSEFAPLPDAPIADYFSVWAFADEDIWAGTRDGELVHFDGANWTVQSSGQQAPIIRMWGSAERELFYISEIHFGRVRAGLPETLIADTAQIRFWDLWGRATSEVFLTLTDPTLADHRCGPRRIVWFDGELFHPF